ncbi:carboxypeptidase activation peptide [Ancylostoma ceylanicum]|uniref:Zinc carboxypeptidase A 1 n=1 Tax=Ancylostoma ceylanicum TaxID=53326 RepID=A0A0D6LS85_9BILA|nr:carboxypeptidase activation peptide [Ancylostoma ceylanicum]
MISNRLVVVVLSSLLVWTSAKKFSVLRLKPSTKADVDFLHDLYMNDVKLDFWKSPTEPGKEVHVMVNDEAEENLLLSLDARNISHSVMIEDVKKYAFLYLFTHILYLSTRARNFLATPV